MLLHFFLICLKLHVVSSVERQADLTISTSWVCLRKHHRHQVGYQTLWRRLGLLIDGEKHGKSAGHHYRVVCQSLQNDTSIAIMWDGRKDVQWVLRWPTLLKFRSGRSRYLMPETLQLATDVVLRLIYTQCNREGTSVFVLMMVDKLDQTEQCHWKSKWDSIECMVRILYIGIYKWRDVSKSISMRWCEITGIYTVSCPGHPHKKKNQVIWDKCFTLFLVGLVAQRWFWSQMWRENHR